jgi:prepilin signal peptidase PulO-like enzyme (type II secretory pathway)
MTSLLIIGIIITIVMGLGWGSFATMATYRLPRNMPWIGDKPRCFLCKTPLSIIDYFSIISFFFHRGECRHCHGKYEESIGYFLTELGITILLVLAFLQYHFNEFFVLSTGVIVGGVILAIIDAQHQKIPAKVLISMLLIGAIYRTYLEGTFYGFIYGCAIGALLGVTLRWLYFMAIGKASVGLDFTRWQHHDRFIGKGFDYVKLLAIIGGWLPLPQFGFIIVTCLPIILLWRLIHPASLRIGTILTMALIFTVLYPSHVEVLWLKLYNSFPALAL